MARQPVDNRSVARKLHCINQWEAAALRAEVATYFTHGIELDPGATVFDVGANIGVFSASVYDRLGGEVRIFAFEPIPEIHAILRQNAVNLFTDRLTTFPYGLSSHERKLEFTYFPGITALSSARRNQGNIEAERDRVARTLAEMISQGGLGTLPRGLPRFITRRLLAHWLRMMRRMRTSRVRVRPLSTVIDEQGVDRIDLLKIDVEGAETDVLRGVEERHWPMIRQAVVEVERWAAEHATIQEIFESRGFQVHLAQDSAQRVGDLGMLYAIRR